MSLYKQYQTSKTAADEGVPVEFKDATNEDGTVPTFYVRFISSKQGKQFVAAHDAAYKPFKRKVEDEDEAATEKWYKKSNELWSDYMLSGWENVQDENGQPLEYSKEAARKILEDLPIVRTKLAGVSADFEKFRKADLEEAAKN